MTDYAKLKVDDIKQMLVEEGRYNKEELDQLDVKGKTGWVALHKGDVVESEEGEQMVWQELDEVLDGVSVAEPTVTESQGPKAPKYTDPEWNDYVMSLFVHGEVIENGGNRYPTLNGMRRIAELLLGDISFSGPIDIKTTLGESIGKAVVTYQIVFDWKLDAFYTGYVTQDGYPQRIFQSVASSWEDNTPDKFVVFTETIAENRAEARTLRRALRLTTVSYEELPDKDTAALVEQRRNSKPTTGDWDETQKVSDAQSNTIKMMCSRLGINVDKFINSGSKKYKEIEEINKQAAAGMIKQLNRYQSSGSDAIEIPLSLLEGV